MKSVQIRSFFWSVFSCIRTEYGDLLRIWILFTQWIISGIKTIFKFPKWVSWSFDMFEGGVFQKWHEPFQIPSQKYACKVFLAHDFKLFSLAQHFAFWHSEGAIFKYCNNFHIPKYAIVQNFASIFKVISFCMKFTFWLFPGCRLQLWQWIY